MKKKPTEENANRFRFRLRVTGGLLLILFVTVAVRAFQLQVIDGDTLARLGEKQHLQEWIVLPKRGSILGRHGNPLAISLEAQSIFVRPRRLETTSRVVPLLADALKMKPKEVRRRIKGESPFVWLRRQVTPRQQDASEL